MVELIIKANEDTRKFIEVPTGEMEDHFSPEDICVFFIVSQKNIVNSFNEEEVIDLIIDLADKYPDVAIIEFSETSAIIKPQNPLNGPIQFEIPFKAPDTEFAEGTACTDSDVSKFLRLLFQGIQKITNNHYALFSIWTNKHEYIIYDAEGMVPVRADMQIPDKRSHFNAEDYPENLPKMVKISKSLPVDREPVSTILGYKSLADMPSLKK